MSFSAGTTISRMQTRAGDASPCCCASLNGRHRIAQIGAQRVGNCLSILPLILVEETTCNEPPDLVLVQR
jgi:hypothetical protein